MAAPDLILLAFDEAQAASPAMASLLPLLEHSLRAAGYESGLVHHRGDLERALSESAPALLLIGERFDGESGLSLAAAQLERFPTLPILLFAEEGNLRTLQAAWAAGLSGCLYPPLQVNEVLQAVEHSLRRARGLGDWLRREIKRTTSSLEQRAALSEMEKKRLETILASLGEAVIVLDAQQNIVLLNEAARRLFGLGEADLTGRPAAAVLSHPELRALLEKAEDQPVRYYELPLEDGRVFHAQRTPISGVGCAITLQDITHLKQLDQMKNDLVNAVSHDLRSPLTAILGYAELIERAAPLTAQQQEFMQRLRSGVQHTAALIDHLLDLRRLEAGLDTYRELVHLDRLVLSSVSLLESIIREKGLRVHQEIEPDLPPLHANPFRIQQVVDNLIDNAVKYTPPQGEISIRLRAREEQLILQITNSGTPIPAEEQAHIFDKYYRARNTDKSVAGRGLGLAIVKSIVEGYHGRVWVESAPGSATSFIVLLPASRDKPPSR